VPAGAAELHAHLFVNAAIHHTAKLGAGSNGNGPVDVGVKVTLFYRSGGKFVALQSQRTKLHALDAKGVDSQTARVMVKIPYGAQPPDPGTPFAGRAQMFTKFNDVDVPFGPAA
jgi:hypothetical protein